MTEAISQADEDMVTLDRIEADLLRALRLLGAPEPAKGDDDETEDRRDDVRIREASGT